MWCNFTNSNKAQAKDAQNVMYFVCYCNRGGFIKTQFVRLDPYYSALPVLRWQSKLSFNCKCWFCRHQAAWGQPATAVQQECWGHWAVALWGWGPPCLRWLRKRPDQCSKPAEKACTAGSWCCCSPGIQTYIHHWHLPDNLFFFLIVYFFEIGN